MSAFVEALRVLAALLEALPSTRAALERWPDEIDDERLARAARQVAHRLHLGAPTRVAFEPLVRAAGEDAQLLIEVLGPQWGSGSAVSGTVAGLADVIYERDRLRAEGRAAGAAATLSTRMIGVMGGAFAFLLPAWRDVPPGTAAATLGLAALLAWAGLTWARRLTPKVATTDDVHAALAELVATLVEAGFSEPAALDVATRDADRFLPARRLVRLGMSWPDALQRSSEPATRRLGVVMGVARQMGVPVSKQLRLAASSFREARARRFDLRARRAPVLLILPLTLCILPSFTLLIGVPLIHSVSS